jgi:hypothetical protein
VSAPEELSVDQLAYDYETARESLASAQQRVALAFDRVIRYKPDLSLRDLRYIEDNEPEYYRAFAGAITTKPAKTSLKVERLNQPE